MSVGRYAGAVLLVAALTACSSGSAEEPRALEPVATASPTADPSATAEPSPEDAVRSAVDAYYAALNRAYLSGDTAEARALLHPQCPCAEQLADIEEIYAAGRSVTGSQYATRETTVPVVQGSSALLEYVIDISAGRLLDGTGRTLEESPPVTGQPLRLQALLVEGAWKVRDITRRDQ